MSTITHAPETLPSIEKLTSAARPPLRRIVVATTGDETCRAALVAAHAIASRHGAHVSVVSVFQPRIAYPAPQDPAANADICASDHEPARRQLAAVRRQLAALAVDTSNWSLAFVAGHPASNIVRIAASDHADLVVIGMGRENAGERGLGDRGSMATAAAVHCPLLAVAPGAAEEVRDVLVAVGRDDTALNAVRTAQLLWPAPDRLYLVYVSALDEQDANDVLQHQRRGIEEALTTWTPARVEARVMLGDPIDQLLSFTQEHEVDLVVGGLHGRSFDERAVMRNTALWLMAVGDRSVLLVPSSGAIP